MTCLIGRRNAKDFASGLIVAGDLPDEEKKTRILFFLQIQRRGLVGVLSLR
jgi:hypothetical protein